MPNLMLFFIGFILNILAYTNKGRIVIFVIEIIINLFSYFGIHILDLPIPIVNIAE